MDGEGEGVWWASDVQGQSWQSIWLDSMSNGILGRLLPQAALVDSWLRFAPTGGARGASKPRPEWVAEGAEHRGG